MNHPDRKTAKRYDTPGRCARFTDLVYSGASQSPEALWVQIADARRSFDPPPPALRPFVGEMHGHTNLSDGKPDIDTYFPILFIITSCCILPTPTQSLSAACGTAS